jgi:hyaluronoglucosaminidase
MGWDVRGLIEGFYGEPWSWDDRIDVGRWCAARGMTHYVYAPKDDPLHRERWREPYGDDAVDAFRRFMSEGGLRLGFALSPGLSIDYGSETDRGELLGKIDQLTSIGVDLVCLALDDIPPRDGLGRSHAELTAWLRDRLDADVTLVLVPTEYTGTDRRTPYLDALADGVPDSVAIAWTGPTVVTDEITVAQATARASALGGRAPLVWDNYPVNDAVMADRLFLGPLRGREAGLVDVCSGWMANPMTQPKSSKLPLASVAAFLRGEDPTDSWEREVDEAGLRVFAEACDGVRPGQLVSALAAVSGPDEDPHDWADALDTLRRWFKSAAACGAPHLGDEATPWLDQAHREAELGLLAVRVLERLRPSRHREGKPPDPKGAFERGIGMVLEWQGVRRGDKSVMGPRDSIRVMFSQDEQGEWLLHREAVQENQNAVDSLVRLTLDQLAINQQNG